MSKAARQERVVGWMVRGVMMSEVGRGEESEVGFGVGGRRAVRKAVRSGLGSGSWGGVVEEEGGLVVVGGWGLSVFEDVGLEELSRGVVSEVWTVVVDWLLEAAQSQPIGATGEVWKGDDVDVCSNTRLSRDDRYGKDVARELDMERTTFCHPIFPRQGPDLDPCVVYIRLQDGHLNISAILSYLKSFRLL